MPGNPNEASIVAACLYDWVFDVNNRELLAESIKNAVREYREEYQKKVNWRANEAEVPAAPTETPSHPLVGFFKKGIEQGVQLGREGLTAISQYKVIDRSVMFPENLAEINANIALDCFLQLANPQYGSWFSLQEKDRASLNTLIVAHIYRQFDQKCGNGSSPWRRFESNPLNTPGQALLIHTGILAIRRKKTMEMELSKKQELETRSPGP